MWEFLSVWGMRLLGSTYVVLFLAVLTKRLIAWGDEDKNPRIHLENSVVRIDQKSAFSLLGIFMIVAAFF